MSKRLPAPPATDRAPLLEALGVGLEEDLLTLALTHRSYAYEAGGLPTNERLEFLGDSVLGISVTEWLYVTHPDKPEGELAKIRASVVNMHALARVARGLGEGGLGAHLFLGRGEELTGGRDKDSILADGTEALLGAVHIEHGIDVAREVVLRLFLPLLTASSSMGAGLDWKTSLQELTAERDLGAPAYRVSSTGPDHDKEFTAVAVVDEHDLGEGVGRTKKEAEQRAAAAAWKSLDEDDSDSSAAEAGTVAAEPAPESA
ncbi:ribonuclease III [Tsukamurella pseudospumae]|uniref:Ribonuclease 3 n=1 Tax=Tsukamurella pseudospumae TaxID=239498 RepID=A0A138AJY0_9ACTN|nr:ribonuclease III [Tsukamurella pseudospumae]KXP10818.1 ribonuclease III [Tsukamurella pseudospumae]